MARERGRSRIASAATSSSSRGCVEARAPRRAAPARVPRRVILRAHGEAGNRGGVSTIKPIFLLADSQLLFWRDGDELFLGRVRALLAADDESAGRAPRAAYLGASNGDAPEFYQLFLAAMDQIEVRDCRQIPAAPAASTTPTTPWNGCASRWSR